MAEIAPTKDELDQITNDMKADRYPRWRREVYKHMRLAAQRSENELVVDFAASETAFVRQLTNDIAGSNCAVEYDAQANPTQLTVHWRD